MLKNYILYVTLLFAFLACSSGQQNGTTPLPETESICLDKENLKAIMQKVADWQINNFTFSTTKNLHDNGIGSWTNATFYLGLLRWAEVDNNNPDYLKWLVNIGDSSNWTMPANFKDYPAYQLYHADEFCMGQMFLGAFDIFGAPKMKTSVQERADWVLNNPPKEGMQHNNKQAWTWCDALFMAPPVYAHLSEATNSEKYLVFMDQEFKKTYNYLYSAENHLFFRDDSYFSKTENNGEKIFWGRGNGWVAAGLANLLRILPEDSAYRPFYENLFREFVPRLISLQSETGFWHASLLDSESYPAPEASATALITYALAYGINNDLLDKETYYPALENAWRALLSIVRQDGKLGWVQPIGADPKKVTADMTATYGVGAFLLAGSEIYHIQ